MKLAGFAALVMLVASCCPCRKHRKGDSKPFVGTEWQLVQLNGRAVPSKATFLPSFSVRTDAFRGLEPATGLWVRMKPRKRRTDRRPDGFDPDVLSRFGPGAGFQRRFVRSDPLRSGRRYADASYRRRTAGCFAGQIAGLCGFCDGGTFRGSSVCIYGSCISFFVRNPADRIGSFRIFPCCEFSVTSR